MSKHTIADLQTQSTGELIATLLYERRMKCSNVYSPLYVELTKLINWVDTLPRTREHEGGNMRVANPNDCSECALYKKARI